jgi:putative ABC transport system permease protein
VASAALSRVGDGQEATWAQVVYTADGSLPELEPDAYECAGCLLADRLVVGDQELLRALGAEAAIGALEAGRAVILSDRTLPLREALFQAADEQGQTRTVTIPVSAVDVDIDPTLGVLPSVVIPPLLAADLGLAPTPFATTYVMRLDRGVTEIDVARAGLMVGDSPGTWADAALGPPRPEQAPRLAITTISFLLALGVAAIAVALGESEARADQRILLAVGADPRVRRRIAAARAGVLGLLAGLLAVPAGLIPAWGLLASRDVELVVPIAEIAVTVAALPLATVLSALLLARPIPAWVAFRSMES